MRTTVSRRLAGLGLLVGVLSVACTGGAPAASPATSAASATSTPAAETSSPPATASTAPSTTTTTVSGVAITDPVPCGANECEVPVDILAPDTGEDLPTVVLVPGGPGSFGERLYMMDLAAGLAKRGAVVFLAAYRSSVTGNTDEESLPDIRCAVRFARANTSQYGGDPERVVLVGHSFGSELVMRAGVQADAESPGCLADGSGVPDSVVALSEFTDPLTDMTAAGPPLLLIGGADDAFSASGEERAQQLRDAGFEAEYVELEGTDHMEIVSPDTSPTVVDMILEAAAGSTP